MRKCLLSTLTLILVCVCASAQDSGNYSGYVEDVESVWIEYSELKEYEEFLRQYDAEFQAFIQEQEEEYRKFVEEVERKWNEFVGSTREEWVEYNEDKSVKSVVNFEEKEEEDQGSVPEGKSESEREKKPEGESEKTGDVPAPKLDTEPIPTKVGSPPSGKGSEIQVAQKKEIGHEVEVDIKTEVDLRTRPEMDREEKLGGRIAEKPKSRDEAVSREKPEEEFSVSSIPVHKPEENLAVSSEAKTRAGEKLQQELKGQITVEAIVPVDDPDAVNKAKKLIANQVEYIFSVENGGKSLLEGQVKTKAGETVTQKNVRKFTEDEILPRAIVLPKTLKSKDGVERLKVKATIPMVPNHLKVRAEQYLPSTRKYCHQYKENIPLIMAVMQTESYFNPLAKSHIPAYGLLQIVPKYAGRDAYKYVFEKDEDPKPDYLYVPDNNILLGIAYLNLLRTKYFYGIKDSLKQEYLMVASYNGGMGRVIKNVLKKYNIQEMSPAQVYETLRKEMPDETKDYLAKVSTRKQLYEAWQ